MIKTITIGNAGYESLEGETILETAERNGVEMASHCRDGFCGACRQRLVRGEVKYAPEPLAFIREGDVLTCCSYPLTDIKIEPN